MHNKHLIINKIRNALVLTRTLLNIVKNVYIKKKFVPLNTKHIKY